MRILAIDHGDARAGTAICDPSGTIVRPLGVVSPPDVGELARVAAEQEAELVVVGLPVSLDGSERDQAATARAFAAELAALAAVPVETYDERLTTRMAAESARGGCRRSGGRARGRPPARVLPAVERRDDGRRLARPVRPGRGGDRARAPPRRARGPSPRAPGHARREGPATAERDRGRRRAAADRAGDASDRVGVAARARATRIADPATRAREPALDPPRARRARDRRPRRRGRLRGLEGDRPDRRRRPARGGAPEAGQDERDDDPRGPDPRPDRRRGEEGRDQGRLRAGDAELQGVRPRELRRRGGAEPGGLPVPGHLERPAEEGDRQGPDLATARRLRGQSRPRSTSPTRSRRT